MRLGPLLLGYEALTDLMHPSASNRTSLGLGGVRKSKTIGTARGVIYPLEEFRINQKSVRRRRPADDNERKAATRSSDEDYPAIGWGCVGIEFGPLVVVGAFFDVVELADFIAGIVCVDLLNDDGEADPASPPSATQPTPDP